jgi:fatty acid desaturase
MSYSYQPEHTSHWESDTDYSQSWNEVRQRLINETRAEYRVFLKDLPANYRRVWFDIGFGYLMLALTLFAVQLVRQPTLLVLVLPVGAVLIGYWVSYLLLFLHEAAHFNLWHERSWNDRLCDIFISWQIGTCIRDYRLVHFQHHRKLGATDDSERSYFSALTWRFLLEMLTGIHALRVFMLQKKVIGSASADSEMGSPEKSPVPLMCGLFIHLALLLGLLMLGAWPSALAWIMGVGVLFPVFATLRPLLEHRAANADPAVNYADVPHGAFTRLFGDDFFSRTFGGAGFNRHLLHHWEPQISYTRLKDLENYLITTSAAPLIRSRKTTYWKTFKSILRNDNARS